MSLTVNPAEGGSGGVLQGDTNGLSAARYCETYPDSVNNFPNGRLLFCSPSCSGKLI